MTTASFSRYRSLYYSLAAAVLMFCITLIPLRAQQSTAAAPTATSAQPTVTPMPCLAPSIEVISMYEFSGEQVIGVKNTGIPAYLTGFTLQWWNAQEPFKIRVVYVTENDNTLVWQSSGSSASPVVGNITSVNWLQEGFVPTDSTALVFFSSELSMLSEDGPFYGTLTFSCKPDGTASASVGFGTHPPTPSPTPITPTPITPAPVEGITATVPPAPPSATPTAPTLPPPVEGITATVPPAPPSATPIVPTPTETSTP